MVKIPDLCTYAKLTWHHLHCTVHRVCITRAFFYAPIPNLNISLFYKAEPLQHRNKDTFRLSLQRSEWAHCVSSPTPRCDEWYSYLQNVQVLKLWTADCSRLHEMFNIDKVACSLHCCTLFSSLSKRFFSRLICALEQVREQIQWVCQLFVDEGVKIFYHFTAFEKGAK